MSDNLQATKSKEPNIPGGTQVDERQVLDPITHLPLTIHDVTDVELERIPPPPSTPEERQAAGAAINQGAFESGRRHAAVEQVVRELTHLGWWNDPGRDLDRVRAQTAIVSGVTAGFGLLIWWLLYHLVGHWQRFRWLDLWILPFGCCLLAILVGTSAVFFKPYQTYSGQLSPSSDPPHPSSGNPDALIRSITTEHPEDGPESAGWLNSFLRSVWPIANPALFTAICDTLEDSLQASLPKLIRGVRVADIGQGTEPVRILCIRWLSAGEAGEDVQGMKAEEGDFINMEVALAYRAKPTTSGGLKGRSANLHLLMEFYISGGMRLPVWVELTGLLTTARLRIQLTPNPPFLAMMKVSLMGQPRITLNCTPLAKSFLNIMDVPGLSGWLQQNIDSVAAEYVAPKSINLDLRSILAGMPKMDVDALGVLVVTVRRATGFRSADRIKILKTGEDGRKGDPYVTLGWSKWGKFVWATRIISREGDPVWEETTAVLVNQQEVDARESFRVQLWDADNLTADDLIGTIDIPLSHLIHDAATHNRISIREDQLLSETSGNPVPGTLLWECGYFPKTTLQQHLEHTNKNYDEIKAKIEVETEKKLREAKTRDLLSQQPKPSLSYSQAEKQITVRDMGVDSNKGVEGKDGDRSREKTGRSEVEQEKEQDLREKGDEIITSSRPSTEYPSGILSIRIEQISGLGINRVRESGVREAEQGTDDDADDLPSAYCVVIINHQRVYKTRTKMKSSNPFFNAGIESFIRDWADTTAIIAVRDNRMHEQSPVLGVVVLPLLEVFHDCSMCTHTLPIVGGIGHGRLRFSLIFRSVQAQLPRRLLGWDVGTLEILPKVYATGGHAQGSGTERKEEGGGGSTSASDLATCRLVFQTQYGKDKMIPFHPKQCHSRVRSQSNASGSVYQTNSSNSTPPSVASAADAEAEWRQKRDRPIRLPVLRRYASCLHVQFRKRALGPDSTLATCMLWLKDIPDEDEVTVRLPIRRQSMGSGGASAKFLKSKDTDNAQATVQGISHFQRGDTTQDLEEGGMDGEPSRRSESVPDMILVVRLRFWHGLSGYHQGIANHEKTLEDLMEVLDCAEEQTDISRVLLHERGGEEEYEAEGEESEEVDEDSADDNVFAPDSSEKNRQDSLLQREETELSRARELKKKESKQSFEADAKAQRRRPKEKHQKHRGLMQWKVMRNVAWVGHGVEGKAEKLGHRIRGGFRSHDREAGIEREV